MKHYKVNPETGVIESYLGEAEPGSTESAELVRRHSTRACDVVVEGLDGSDTEAPLANGTRVRIDAEGVIEHVYRAGTAR